MADADNPIDRRPCVAITGATGFVGRHLARELVSRGFPVRALIRDRSRAAALPDEGVAFVMGDVFNARSMDDLAAGADAIVNLIGIRREMPGGVTFEKLHVQATRAALDAAHRAGVGRFLQMSALGTRPEASSLYHRTKWRAETLVRDSGLDWTIFRPSLILGPDGEFVAMARNWARGAGHPKHFMPYFSRPVKNMRHQSSDGGGRSARLRPVSVVDVARAVAGALESDEAVGEIEPLVGPEELTWPELLVRLRDATPGARKKIPPHGIPARPASRFALVMQKIGLGALLPFGPSEPIMAIEDSVGSPVKARVQLGVEPEAFETTLRWSAAS